jgi:hypothetical protein
VPGVLAAYRTQGFALVRRLEIDGWVSLQLGRAQRPIEARVREASSAPSRA